VTAWPGVAQRLGALLLAASTLAVGGLWITSAEHDTLDGHAFYDTRAEWPASQPAVD